MRPFLVIWLAALLVGGVCAAEPALGKPALSRLTLEPVNGARYHFTGVLGPGIDRDVKNWLIPAPVANPGLTEMFQLRDRLPAPRLVPWAGEFAGKYLISATQALRMSEDPELKRTAAEVVRRLIAGQAEDGYLGPFPKAERLKGNWDLWGHYHCMEGLLAWHRQTGDPAALRAARRAADLICATYLDTVRRIYDAGSQEMNMAVIHGLGMLYRETGEPRYLRMMREIERDWERAGDYVRTAQQGLEFFQTPRPRWESLHDLQGLVELYQITGEAKYREAFEHHWRSILRWDRRNTGGFSSGEQATGDPYAPTAIETCCTVAWMALTLDELRLTGDPLAADEFELSLYNAAAGAQHPSGRWWTYNTPMDGVREASAHTIVFQARAGTPELNCCSVNGPRTYGMLSEWAVMSSPGGLTVNSYQPGTFRGRLPNGTPIRLEWQGEYPVETRATLVVHPQRPVRARLRFRIPRWAALPVVTTPEGAAVHVRQGSYFELERLWKPGDRVGLDFRTLVGAFAGDRETLNQISLYRGPLLLAYDQAYNTFDADSIPAVEPYEALRTKRVTSKPAGESSAWLLVDVPAAGGKTLRLCDFASAGMAGTHYRSWLPAGTPIPGAVVARTPRDGARIAPGAALFRWSGPSHPTREVASYAVTIARDAGLHERVLEFDRLQTNRLVVDAEQLSRLKPNTRYWWQAYALGPVYPSSEVGPPVFFSIDPSLAAVTEAQLRSTPGSKVLVSAALTGTADAQVGRLIEARGNRRENGPEGRKGGSVGLDGVTGRLKYEIEEFPEEDWTVAVRFYLESPPQGRLGQVFSAWTAPQDDPLRMVIQDGRLYARIEAGGAFGTDGVPVATGRWYTAVAVKEGPRLTLYLDGRAAASANVPNTVHSNSREVALGGNPRFAGNEFLRARFAGFRLVDEALSPEEAAAGL